MKRALLILFVPFSLWGSCCHWAPSVGAEGRVGNFRQGAGADFWIPTCQDGRSVWFMQGGAGYFRSLTMGTFGVGYRTLWNPVLAFGANLFGELGYSSAGRLYPQIGGGIEIFGCSWLFRANGYLPYPRRINVTAPDGGIVFRGPNVFKGDRIERAYPGLDLEGGAETCFGPGHLWLYAGYFCYKWKQQRARQGPRVRLEYRLDQCWPIANGEILFSCDYEHDFLHGNTISGYVEARVYLDRCYKPCCQSNLCRYMGRPVWRNRAIWVDRTVERETFLDQLIFVDESTNGNGSQTNPTTLANAVSIWQPEGVIFLLNNTGTIVADGTVVGQPDGQILGFDAMTSRTVVFPDGLTVEVNDLTGAGMATVDGSALATVVESANNLFISGFAISGGNTQILQQAGDAIAVDTMILTGAVNEAIFNDGAESLTVTNSTIATPGAGVRALMSQGDVSVLGGSIIGLTGTGIDYDTPSAGRLFVNATLFTVAGDAISLTLPRTVLIQNVTVAASDNGVASMDVGLPPSKDVRVLNSVINAANRGVEFITGPAPTVGVFQGLMINAPEGIVGITSASAGPFNILVSNNQVINGITGISWIMASDTTIEISNNMSSNLQGPAVQLSLPSGLPLASPNNITVTGNLDNSFGVPTGYAFSASVGAATPTCATIANNNRVFVGGAAILLSGFSAPTREVFDFSGGAAGLSATNNALTVSVVGGAPAAAAAACPLPIIP